MRSIWKSHFLTLCLIALDMIFFSMIWVEAWQLRDELTHRFTMEVTTIVEGVETLQTVRIPTQINAFENYRHALPILLVVWLAVLAIFQQYSHKDKISSLNQVSSLLKSAMALFVVTLAFAQLTKWRFDLGSSVIGFASLGIFIYLYFSRSCLKAFKEKLREKGYGLTRVAIIGAGQTGQAVARRIVNHPEVGYELIGFIDKDSEKMQNPVTGVPVIGNGKNLVDLLLRHRIEEVFLAVPSMAQDVMFDIIVECEAAGVHFKIVSNDLLQVITDRVKIDDIGDFPVILLREGRLSPWAQFAKRMLDLVLVVPALPLAVALTVIIAVLIKLDSKGPVIFSHDRVGLDGRIFRLHKFRTMRSDANPYQTAPNDQGDNRVTRFGRLLRKTSLDELPQLWNVLVGDMSLVGPRPEMPFIVEQYTPWQRRRLDVPPGLTGLWQIAGRKHLPLHYNLEYDFYYIRNWSLLLDLTILIRTIPAVLLGKGAY